MRVVLLVSLFLLLETSKAFLIMSKQKYSFRRSAQEIYNNDAESLPIARIVGAEEDEIRTDLQEALKRNGFVLATNDQDSDEHIYTYRWNPAVGMLQLASADDDSMVIPRWIPIVQEQENVLVANGWSFLDADESEKMSAIDIAAVNSEGLYQPKWGQQQESQHKISALGFSLQPPSEAEILERAWKFENELSRQVLMEGATDPPGRKRTQNGYEFTGSVVDVEPGIFTCALTGLPLFASTDLSVSTATSAWLSFARPLCEDHVVGLQPDKDSIDQRVEVVCGQSGCHLGHYFGINDGYCINASALNFIPPNQNQNKEALVVGPFSYRALENAQDAPAVRLLRQVIRQSIAFETIVVGGGCFWHIEFALRRLPGVIETAAGYAGGTTADPTYKQVCEQETGHAEVVKVEFDPKLLDPRVLLDCFLALHDPTKVRAHGKHAYGTGQYRSCIFLPANSSLKEIANEALQDCQAQLGKELVTELRIMETSKLFWMAEERHQRHDERQDDCSNGDLSTLCAEEWIRNFGRRSASVLGSSNTVPVNGDRHLSSQSHRSRSEYEEAVAQSRFMI